MYMYKRPVGVRGDYNYNIGYNAAVYTSTVVACLAGWGRAVGGIGHGLPPINPTK